MKNIYVVTEDDYGYFNMLKAFESKEKSEEYCRKLLKTSRKLKDLKAYSITTVKLVEETNKGDKR